MYPHPLVVSAIPPGEPNPRAKHIRFAETVAALWGNPRLREKYKLGTGPWGPREISERPKPTSQAWARWGGQYLMLALMPQALCGEVVNSQRAVKIAHSSQWHPTDREEALRDMGKQGWKHIKAPGKRQTLH